MRASKGVGQRRLWLGVAALGVFVFGLSLQGAPKSKSGSTPLQLNSRGTSGALPAGAQTSSSETSPTMFTGSHGVKAGTLPNSANMKVVNTVTVDYRDDRGTREREQGILFGPLPYPGVGNVAVACGLPACSFNIECDDANPCTVDTCNIVAGTGTCTGTCEYNPVANGAGATCDDGLTCNGFEACQGSVCAAGSARNVGLACDEHATCRTLGVCTGGTCTTGLPGEPCVDSTDCAFPGTGTCAGGVCAPGTAIVCCITPPDQTVCTENVAKCSAGSDNPGLGCTSDAQCRNGQCEFCQPGCTIDADCNDGKKCNGAERCIGGVCNAGLYNPCGAGATCFEGDCTAANRNLCNTTADCASGTCNVTGAAYCALGRCCSDVADPVCTKGCLDLDGRFGVVCDGASNPCSDTSLWYAGDTGEHTVEGACGGNDTNASALDAWECPKYGSGFVQKTITDAPVWTIAVGPVSDSPQNAPAPNGPGTPFLALGDDYTFENNSYIGVEVVRWVGEVIAGNRISMEFYDAGGVFIEDIVLPALGGGFGPHVVVMTPALILPPSGYVVMRVAFDFSPNTRFVVAATNNTDVGSNNPAQLWVHNGTNGPNGGPVANFLGANPGILAIEMAGDKVGAPTGACCNGASGECVDNVISWNCEPTGGTWTLGEKCAACNGGGNAAGNCRRCSNAPATVCTSDANCPGGSCDPAPAACPGLACTQGLVGENCTVPTQSADCGVPGTCCLSGILCLLNTCSQGNLIGAACTSNAQCSVAGICGNASCVPLAECGAGACCAANGTCSISPSEVSCQATVGSTWQGYNSDCDPNCCTVPPIGLRCMGGPNNLDACLTNIQCGACKGGSANGGVCDDEADCPNSGGPVVPDGACIDVPILGLRCAGGLTPNSVCSNSYDCGGSVGTCVGRCVTRGTGADNAWDAFVHVITVPTNVLETKVITISGNNNPASASEEQPDGCFGFNAAAVNNDPGWYEAFSIDACARVRIDTCCSNPIKQPMWAFISTDPECNNNLGAALDPFSVIAQGLNARGAPYCDEDNLWTTYGLLRAGTYYQPVLSSLSGSHGSYQLHITIEACPAAACCSTTCTGGAHPPGTSCRDDIDCGSCSAGSPIPGLACDHNQDCAPGTCTVGACDAKCAELNTHQCEAVDGFYLGKPNVGTSQPLCLGNPGVCAAGACCTGPGVCVDRRENAGTPINKTECENRNGAFTGGVECAGGDCTGAGCVGYSCADATGCCAGSVCTGDTGQANPCPLCEYISNDTCQRDPGAFVGTMYLADTSSNVSPTRIADDVLLTESGSLTSICVIGSYVDFAGGAHYCGDPAQSGTLTETFTVRVFATAGAVDYTPGLQVGPTVTVPASSFNKKLEYTSGGYKFFRHQLNLSPAIPGLVAGNVYWIQVANNTISSGSPTAPGCNWFWLNSTAGEGNDLFFQDLGNFYSAADAEDGDISLCLNLGFDTPPTPTRACCTCDPITPCQVLNFLDCTALGGNWRLDILDCSGTLPLECQNLPPANDTCAAAFVVGNGERNIKNFCADTDGPAEVDCVVNDPPDPAVSNPSAFENDVWFHYTATCSGSATVSMCDNDRGFDTVLAVYYNPANSAVCPCPTDNSLLLGTCNDDDTGFCDSFFGVSTVEIPVTEGDCYTIRVGGFNGAQGNARLSISCGPPPTCGNGVVEPQGGEQCDGAASTNCPPALCRPPTSEDGCTCITTCGNSIVEFGEECDGVASTACPPSSCRTPTDPAGGCTCLPCCGNGRIDAGELCDPGDPAGGPTLCGNVGAKTPVAGPCTATPTACNATCSCITSCGDNVREIGEDCDGTADVLCPTRCGLPGAPTSDDCKCPPAVCGNNYVEALSNGEECDGTDLTGDGACDPSECRPPGDPAGECTCACPTGQASQPYVWDPANGATRTLVGSAPPVVTSTGASPQIAIQVRMVDLQTPTPPNALCCPAQNFSAYESATCTALGETGGCARWAGRPQRFLESQDNLAFGSFKGARLQCSPFYHDFGAEGLFSIFGAEIVPSSTYAVKTFSADCKGTESTCAFASAETVVITRRSGDAVALFQPPALVNQPDGNDVVALVNKFKNLSGAPAKSFSQIFGNILPVHLDVAGLDISAAVDAFKGLAYPYSGPCACPSSVTCGATTCTADSGCAGGLCVRTCGGGPNDGQPCTTNKGCRTCAGGPFPGFPCELDVNCGAGGTCAAVASCGTSGTCRDRCGRCKP